MARIGLVLIVLVAVAPVAAEPARRMKPEARVHLERGLRLYDREKYDEAVSELRAGLAIDPQPDLLYALGQAERRRGNCRRAVEYYESCLALVKDPAAQAAVRVQIERCHVGDEEPEPSRAPAEATPRSTAPPAAPAATDEPAPKESAALPESSAAHAPATAATAAKPAKIDDDDDVADVDHVARATASPRWYRDGLGVTLTVVGVAAIGAGGALVGLARARLDVADQSYQQYADARDAPAWWTGGIITLAVGGALTVGGVARLAVVAARHSHSTAAP